ncbi:hypothetical protein K8O92_19435 [Nocardia asteroides]|uniref:hypothetical protein n=1 Tax=Nocardia TaxID=1817 RepID=UPI0018953F81|nr:MULTISPECIES: hypothetical protein [Nocardia]MBF6203283.1 hypothetical protein [Streptomyces gardneri]UAK30123.1 hypothetical protein K8O92_19435 [Nocardia asteroides]
MKLPTTGRIAVASLAFAAALGLAACGGDDASDSPTATRTTAAASPTGSTPAPPTVDELNALLQRALDPTVPNEQKLESVQGIEADPALPNRLADAFRQANATAVVTGVTVFGDSVSAQAKFTINGQENPVDVPFVLDGGKWKVQKAWACQALANLNQQSPACVP